MGFTQIIKPDVNIPFIKNRLYAVILSVIAVTVAVIVLWLLGFNYGIEFAGGIDLRVSVPGDNVTSADITQTLADNGVTNVTVHEFADIDGVYSIKIKGTALADQVQAADEDERVDALQKMISDKFGKGNAGDESVYMVDSQVAESLKKKGIFAILYAIAGILIYIGFRFNFRYAPGAVVALVHDVTITAGIFAFIQHEISLAVIAAFLTIAGYSINDTIIVFDRIREGLSRYREMSLPNVVNLGINQTLSRTLLTSITTLLVVVSLYVLGGENLRDFALAMIIGVGVGTYSSIFVASPIFLALEEYTMGRRQAAKKRRR